MRERERERVLTWFMMTFYTIITTIPCQVQEDLIMINWEHPTAYSTAPIIIQRLTTSHRHVCSVAQAMDNWVHGRIKRADIEGVVAVLRLERRRLEAEVEEPFHEAVCRVVELDGLLHVVDVLDVEISCMKKMNKS